MYKKIIYIVLSLLIGLLAGYLFFGNKSVIQSESTEQSHQHQNNEKEMWTCSMHPQIKQPESGKCPICGMELIPFKKAHSEISTNEFKMTPNAMALANIETIVIDDSNVDEVHGDITLSGKIIPNQESNTIQVSYFDGRIEKLFIKSEGQQVRKGQLLANIYAPSLINAQQELITTSSIKSSQPELYKAVRKKLKLWKLSDQQINQIEASGQVKDVFPIYATVSGTVSEKLTDEGDYVSQGEPILKLNNLNTVWAILDAYENQIADLKIGSPVKLFTNAYPNKFYDAKITFIDPILDMKTRTVGVRVSLNNSNGLLKPGMFVTGKISKTNDTKISTQIQVPASAVLWTGKRSLVYVKTKPQQPIFEMREITLGKRFGEFYVVEKGLKKGDEVVVNGTFTVDAAAQLQGKKSMMTHTSNSGNQLSEHEIPNEFSDKIDDLRNLYFKIKDALVNENAHESKDLAKLFSKDLKNVKTQSIKDEKIINDWNNLSKHIQTKIDEISNNDNLEKQRNSFMKLSEYMLQLSHLFGNKQPIYKLRCPMANSDKGAIWLSTEKEIKNPYFGKSMIGCGQVEEEIK